jgi:hypothetical protein
MHATGYVIVGVVAFLDALLFVWPLCKAAADADKQLGYK